MRDKVLLCLFLLCCVFFLVSCGVKPESDIRTQVEQYFYENVSEVQLYQKYIQDNSNGQANLIVRVEAELITIPFDDEKQYYAIYVGESWDDHMVNWDWFYVREDLKKILWYAVVDDMYFTLDKWRESEYYRNLE